MTEEQAIAVNIDNYVAAETAAQFAGIQGMARGVNRFTHARVPIRLDRQTAPRMNRDTIYSSAIVDVSAGATLLIPDAGERYLSVQVINECHYTMEIFHGAGERALTADALGSSFVAVVVRILANPADANDMEVVRALQSELTVSASSDRPYEPPDYDTASRRETQTLLQQLGASLKDAAGANGRPEAVNPVRHLVVTAMGWGGLPSSEVVYENHVTELPVGDYTLRIDEVPTDAFWSISIYNADGYFEENSFQSYSMNSVIAVADDDGSTTLNFGAEPRGRKNFLYVMDGWSYGVRFYQPRAAIRDGDWRFPVPAVVPPVV